MLNLLRPNPQPVENGQKQSIGGKTRENLRIISLARDILANFETLPEPVRIKTFLFSMVYLPARLLEQHRTSGSITTFVAPLDLSFLFLCLPLPSFSVFPLIFRIMAGHVLGILQVFMVVKYITRQRYWIMVFTNQRNYVVGLSVSRREISIYF